MSVPTWDTERAATLARRAYRYVARATPQMRASSPWTSIRTPLCGRRPPATSTLTRMRSGR